MYIEQFFSKNVWSTSRRAIKPKLCWTQMLGLDCKRSNLRYWCQSYRHSLVGTMLAWTIPANETTQCRVSNQFFVVYSSVFPPCDAVYEKNQRAKEVYSEITNELLDVWKNIGFQAKKKLKFKFKIWKFEIPGGQNENFVPSEAFQRWSPQNP